MKKKTRSLALLMIFVLLTLVACKSKESKDTPVAELNYKAFVISSSDSLSGVQHEAETDIKMTDTKEDATVKKNVKITIDNQTIEGTYSHSEKIFPNNFYTHVYYGETKLHKFKTDDSGRLQFYIWGGLDSRPSSTKIYSEEECMDIAKNFILKNISSDINFAEYTITASADESMGLYHFLFRKQIKGYATTEEASVDIYKNGGICSYSSFMFDRIPNNATNIDSEKITQCVENKLDAIYQNVKHQYALVAYEEIKTYFTLLEDNKPAIYCTAMVRFETGDGGSFSEMVSLIIT